MRNDDIWFRLCSGCEGQWRLSREESWSKPEADQRDRRTAGVSPHPHQGKKKEWRTKYYVLCNPPRSWSADKGEGECSCPALIALQSMQAVGVVEESTTRGMRLLSADCIMTTLLLVFLGTDEWCGHTRTTNQAGCGWAAGRMGGTLRQLRDHAQVSFSKFIK